MQDLRTLLRLVSIYWSSETNHWLQPQPLSGPDPIPGFSAMQLRLLPTQGLRDTKPFPHVPLAVTVPAMWTQPYHLAGAWPTPGCGVRRAGPEPGGRRMSTRSPANKEQPQGLHDRHAMFVEERKLEAGVASASLSCPTCATCVRSWRASSRVRRPARPGGTRLVGALRRGEPGLRGAEGVLKARQRDVDGATLTRLDLEKKVESLLDELAFVHQVHDEEVAQLPATLRASSPVAAEYESLATENLQSADEWYQSRFASLNKQAARSTEAIRASREETQSTGASHRHAPAEIEGLRGAHEASERQSAEVTGCQDSTGQLQNELRDTKREMALPPTGIQDSSIRNGPRH
ncbi:Alpha-internexin [Sciurus carolinensis]|uniref:Alpha-internexin n=1 Tax=Sciurus carolinensis TaxID=30640 RepID=A0AA41NCI2_SCICA|nr:Alpha-internexin [Sciurus carolinensis]